MEKKRNLWVIPTDKPSRLYLTTHEYIFEEGYSLSTDECENKHIYITSNKEIKEGDWFLCLNNRKCNDSIYKANEAWLNMEEKQPSYCKKIILTDNKDLIKDGVQAIDDEFLEWFVKNPSCEEVELFNQDVYSMGKWNTRHKIIIPKECMITKIMQMDAKMAYDSLPKQDFPMQKLIDIMEADGELRPKQETVEEYFLGKIKEVLQFDNDAQAIRFMEKYFKAKKEQERSYSEEEVKKLIVDFLFTKGIGREVGSVNNWFEQLKKK